MYPATQGGTIRGWKHPAIIGSLGVSKFTPKDGKNVFPSLGCKAFLYICILYIYMYIYTYEKCIYTYLLSKNIRLVSRHDSRVVTTHESSRLTSQGSGDSENYKILAISREFLSVRYHWISHRENDFTGHHSAVMTQCIRSLSPHDMSCLS